MKEHKSKIDSCLSKAPGLSLVLDVLSDTDYQNNNDYQDLIDVDMDFGVLCQDPSCLGCTDLIDLIEYTSIIENTKEHKAYSNVAAPLDITKTKKED